ncbi:MAG: LON peptidase substrate-binding domain-containing protein [Chloroflexota bacterium]
MVTTLPLFPLGTVLFPGMFLPLHLFEERYRRLMTERRHEEPVFGIVLTRRGREVGEQPEIHDLGVAASLVAAGEYADGRWDVIVMGGRRFRFVGGDWSQGYLTGEIEWLEDAAVADDGATLAALADAAAQQFERFLIALERTFGEELPRKELPADPSERAWALCARLPVETWDKQRLLEAATTADRLTEFIAMTRRERDLLVNTGIGGSAGSHAGLGFSPN